MPDQVVVIVGAGAGLSAALARAAAAQGSRVVLAARNTDKLTTLALETNARLVALGGTPFTGSPAEFGKLIADETEKWAKVVKFAGIKPD